MDINSNYADEQTNCGQQTSATALYLLEESEMPENNEFYLCQALEHNISEEAKAREEYYRLLEMFQLELSQREKEELREIIAEELKHSEMLAKMIYRRTGIVAEK